jgi:hypothetical protein
MHWPIPMSLETISHTATLSGDLWKAFRLWVDTPLLRDGSVHRSVQAVLLCTHGVILHSRILISGTPSRHHNTVGIDKKSTWWNNTQADQTSQVASLVSALRGISPRNRFLNIYRWSSIYHVNSDKVTIIRALKHVRNETTHSLNKQLHKFQRQRVLTLTIPRSSISIQSQWPRTSFR